MAASHLLPTGSVDHCLKIPEIVDLVFEELCTGQGYSPTHTWVDLAVTTRSFTEAALNILWRELDGLIPLFKVLPGDVWEEKPGGAFSSTTTWLLRDPVPADWTRLCHYNWRILRVRLPGSGDSSFYSSTHDSPAIQRLCELCPYTLLPSVLEVELDCYANLTYSLPYFANNAIKITHLQFSGNSFHFDKKEFCDLVVRHCSQLRVLHLASEIPSEEDEDEDENNNHDDDVEQFTRMITNLPNLRDLAVTSDKLLNRIVIHLGGLRHLRELDLNRGPIINRETGRLLASTNRLFNQLEVLRAWIVDWEAAQTTFESLHCPFRSLSLTIDETPNHLSELVMNTIASMFSNPALTHTLTSLSLLASPASSLAAGPRLTEYRDDDKAIQATFGQLHSLTSLQKLTLRGIFFGRLGDAWFCKAATSWPRLRELRFFGLPTSPKPTLAGLIPFVMKCPSLHSLSLTATWKPFDLSLLDEGVHNTAITSLGVSGPLVDAQGTFYCLKHLFPRLRQIKPERDVRQLGPWGELEALIKGDSETAINGTM